MDDQPPGPLAAPPRERAYVEGDARVRGAPPPQTVAPRATRSRLRRALWLLLVLLVVGGLATWVAHRAAHQPAPAGRLQSTGPTPVGTAKVTKGDMPIVLTGLGTVTPLATVTVKTQIAGQLIEIAFQEGQIVKKGDFLAQIDPRPYQAALEQAQGQLAKDEAALKDAELDLARYRTLVAQNSIARQTLDTQLATVHQDTGTVQTDQALVDTQKLNLVYCHIVAPVSGRVGLRQVDQGNYVQTSDANGIVVITQLQPMSVIFTLPEDNLPAVLKRVHAGATLQVTAFDRAGTTKLDTGKLETTDNQIDPTTGTVKLRAIFDNTELNLFPQQFVNAQLLVDTLANADLVPNSAIQRGAPGTFVYVVKPDNTVAAQPVTLGPADDRQVAITKGLQPDQLVVIDGADRLKDGAKVAVVEPAPPAAAAGGTPPPAGAAPTKGPPQGQGKRRSGE